MSAPEDLLIRQLRLAGLPEPFREYAFAAELGVRWRSDLCFFDARLLVEVEGGTWTGGRHTRGAGFEEDANKYAMATLLGWRLLRFTPDQIERGLALAVIDQAVRGGEAGVAALLAEHRLSRELARARASTLRRQKGHTG